MAAKVDAETKTNTFDPQRAEKLVGQMEKINEDFLAHKMAYVASCAPFQKRLKDKLEEASNFGIPKRVLKAKVKERDHLRKAGAIADDFEEDDKQTFEQLTQALGGLADLPLGKAALDDKKAQDGGGGAPAQEAPKPRRGRPPKATAPATPAPPVAEPHASAEDEQDLRPAHLQRNEADRVQNLADERAAEENRKRLEGPCGIGPLVH